MVQKAVSFEKKLLAEELLKSIRGKNCIFFSRYSKIGVNDFGELRRKLEKVSDRSLVVKNALMKRVLEAMGIGNASDFLTGSVFVTVCERDPQNLSREISGCLT